MPVFDPLFFVSMATETIKLFATKIFAAGPLPVMWRDLVSLALLLKILS